MNPYLGDYFLVGQLGAGGMGEVWRAKQESVNRTVALKWIWSNGDPARRERFYIEARAAASLDHRNIVTIYDVGEADGRHYIAMELMEGRTLADQIADGRWRMTDRNRPEQQKAIAELMIVVARAVHHAHERGVLHRDLKPGNILFDGAGEPHVADFGLAKLINHESGVSQSGMLLGTLEYMPPEQALGDRKALTTAADIYALGAILYELLTGCRLFAVGDTEGLIKKILDEEPRRPRAVDARIDRRLEIICLRCLEKDPTRRLPSAEYLARQLERWLAGEPLDVDPPSNAERVLQWARRRPAVAALTALSCVLLLVIVVGSPIAIYRISSARGAAESAQRAEELARRDAETARDLADKKAAAETAARKDAVAEKSNAEAARVRAETSAEDARRQKTLAEAATEEARRQRQRAEAALNRLILQTSSGLDERGDLPGAVAYLASVLKQSPDNPRVSERLLSLLKFRNFYVPVRTSSGGLPSAGFDRSFLLQDGQWLALSRSNRLTLHRTSDHARIGGDMDFSGTLLSVEASPDGAGLIAIAAQQVRPRPVTGLRIVAPFEGDSLPIGPMKGTGILGGGESAVSDSVVIHRWRVDKPAAPPEIVTVTNAGRFLGFTAKGAAVVTEAGEAVRIWKLGVAQPIAVLTNPQPASLAKFSSNGNKVVIARSNLVTVVTLSGTTNTTIETDLRSSAVSALALSEDGGDIVMGTADGRLHVWALATGEGLIASEPGGGVPELLKLAPMGRRVLAVDAEGVLRCWPLGSRLMAWSTRTDHAVVSAEFDHTGQQALVVYRDGMASVVDARSGRPSAETFGGLVRLREAHFGPGLRTVVTLTENLVQTEWRLLERTELAEVCPAPMAGEVSVGFTGDMPRIAAVSKDGTLTLRGVGPGDWSPWSIDLQSEFARPPLPPPLQARKAEPLVVEPRAAIFRSKVAAARIGGQGDRLVAVVGSGAIAAVDLSSNPPRLKWVRLDTRNPPGLRGVTNRSPAGSVRNSTMAGRHEPPAVRPPEREWIVSADLRRVGRWIRRPEGGVATVHVWDGSAGTLVATAEMEASPSPMLAFDAGGDILAVASAGDHKVWLWDVTNAFRRERFIPLPNVAFVQFLGDTRALFVSSQNGACGIWDAQRLVPKSETFYVGKAVRACAASRDGRRVAVATADGEVAVWDVESAQKITDWAATGRNVINLAFGKADAELFVICDDGILARSLPVAAAPLDPGVIEVAEAMVGRRLDRQGVPEVIPIPAMIETLTSRSGVMATNAAASWLGRRLAALAGSVPSALAVKKSQ